MARPLRVEFGDAIYHVCARGNGRQRIFYDELMQNPRKSQEAMNGKMLRASHLLAHGQNDGDALRVKALLASAIAFRPTGGKHGWLVRELKGAEENIVGPKISAADFE
jgi:hypothetical protein